MAITILPQEDSAWGNVASQTGQGIGKGIEALANMKMQEYANKQLIKQQNEQNEYNYQQNMAAAKKAGIPEFLLPLLRQPELFKAGLNAAAMGWNPQGGQQGPQGGIAQTMGALNPQQQQYQGAENYLGLGNNQQMPSLASMLSQNQTNPQEPPQTGAPQAPGMVGTDAPNDFLTATRNARMNKPEIVAADRRQKENQEFKTKERERAAQQQEDKEIRQNNAKFREKELATHQAFQHVGTLSKKAQKIIDQYGAQFPKGISKYSPHQWQKVLIQNPYVRNYMGVLQDIVLEKLKGMKGQPRQWEAELINNTKAWIDQPIETQKMRLKQLEEDAAIDAHRLSYENTLDRRKGRPTDLVRGMQAFEQAQIDPLASPEPYKIGTILPAKYSPNGKRNKVVMVNGEKQFEELP